MMFFNNMFGNMQQPQQAPVMGAPGSPFAMPMQQQQMQPQIQVQTPQMQRPLMMMQGGQISQVPQNIQDMLVQQGGNLFSPKGGDR